MRRVVLGGVALVALLGQGCCGGLFDRMCERHQDRCNRACDRPQRERCYEPDPCDAPVYRPSRREGDGDRRSSELDPPPRYTGGR
jgi:hypothetical protein